MAWRFLDTGTGSAMFAMALDEAILNAVERGDSPPTIRLYGFEPCAITLGFSQKADRLLDLEACERANIDVTRRFTGGRAVLHADEITYSVIGGIDDSRFGGGIGETYHAIGAALLDALIAVGIPAELSRGITGRHAGEAGNMAPCFLSTSRHEIAVRGRKIVGSAQRRTGRVFLQHGSILTGSGHRRIAEFLLDRRLAEAWAVSLERLTTDCAAELGRPVVVEEIKKALRRSFERRLGMPLPCEQPRERELEDAELFMRERYALKGWVMRDDG